MNITENYRSITIKEALENIDSRTFLLPAIQRKFLWRKDQIENLFDSLLQGYPINTMMVWNVTSPDVKRDFQFYEFLKRYCEFFKDENEKIATVGFSNFDAVIDGQQRLTSIYIGLKGSYALKRKYKHWPKSENEDAFPREKLYIDLKGPNDDEDDPRRYVLAFLTDAAAKADNAAKKHCWFLLGDILSYVHRPLNAFLVTDVNSILGRFGLLGTPSATFASETLCQIYRIVLKIPTIHYYVEKDQDLDRVLTVFVRTNNGGTPLSMSSLLMSVAIAKWNDEELHTDPRTEIDELVKAVWLDSSMSFSIDQDWVLKTCLYLTGADVRFKVGNFTKACVSNIQAKWKDIRDAIRATFEFLNKMGVRDGSLPAKNAVIPLIYYLYKKCGADGVPLFRVITRMRPGMLENQKRMVKWLNIVTLKRSFGGQSDSILSKLRKIIDDNLGETLFPYGKIVDAFKGLSKDMRFNADEVEQLLQLHKDNPMCRVLLMILFPEMNVNFAFDIDHLHPKDGFMEAHLKKCEFLVGHPDRLEYYKNSDNWDTVPNLHLLNDSQNRAKKKRPLIEWIDDPACQYSRAELLVPMDFDLSFANFPAFVETRKTALKQRFADAVEMVADERQTILAETTFHADGDHPLDHS